MKDLENMPLEKEAKIFLRNYYFSRRDSIYDEKKESTLEMVEYLLKNKLVMYIPKKQEHAITPLGVAFMQGSINLDI